MVLDNKGQQNFMTSIAQTCKYQKVFHPQHVYPAPPENDPQRDSQGETSTNQSLSYHLCA